MGAELPIPTNSIAPISLSPVRMTIIAIAMADQPINLALSFIFIANVTGQRTRHLVAGTLDPLVGTLRFIIIAVP